MVLLNMTDRDAARPKPVKIFWEDPYATDADVKITSVDGAVVTVDRTVAFAWPGGQIPDSGNIGGWTIAGARYDDGEIYYTLDTDHRLRTGDTVTMGIDWKRRYACMKLHFAAELAIVILRQKFGLEPELLSRADILSTEAVLEYTRDGGAKRNEGTLEETFPGVKSGLDDLIRQDAAIVSGWLDRETEKRFWEIPGLAKVPCNGTHLRRTGEIGALRLEYRNPAPGVEGMLIFLAARG